MIPAGIQAILDRINKPKEPVFNWKQYFRRFLGNVIESDTRLTRRKESNRFADSPGIKIFERHKILVAVDTSGSVSNKELEEFFGEIYHIYKAGAQVDVLECDADISPVFKYKGELEGIKITGRGGTVFEPVIEYWDEHRKEYSTCVFFTDGYAPLPPRPKKPMMWVITSNGNNQKYPGYIIKIPNR